MLDRRAELVSRRAIVTASGASLFAPLIASQAQAQTGSDGVKEEAATSNLRFQQSGAGAVERSIPDKLGDVVSVLDYGAVGDGLYFSDGWISSGKADFTSASSNFTIEDVGKIIAVFGAGPGGGVLVSTIAGRVSASHVTLAHRASTSKVGAKGYFGTDDTAAIQKAIRAHNRIYYPGTRAGRGYMFTSLKQGFRTKHYGDGSRNSVLIQIASATEAAITVAAAPLGASDISDGGWGFVDIGLDVSPQPNLSAIVAGPGVSASMFDTVNFRLTNQHAYLLTSTPYTVPAGSTALELVGSSGTALMANHRSLEIRSFETAIRARDVVNEVNFHGWIIDCKYAFSLSNISTWTVEASIESGVENARCYVIDGPVSGLRVMGGRWELTQSGGYAFDFGRSLDAYNVRVFDTTVLISGDGSGLPGRKWTGAPPEDMIVHGYYQDLIDKEIRPFMIVPANVPMRMPSRIRVGGAGVGDGRIEIGRDSDSNARGLLYNDGTHVYLIGGNDLVLGGDGVATKAIRVNSTGNGFNGKAAIPPPTLPPAATDLASVIALVNALRTASIANGLSNA